MFFKLVRISKRPKLAGGCTKGFMGEGWGLGVRVLHFSHFHDEKSAFFQLEVSGLQ